nr:hypothetical protein [Phytohabitans houttuyneae]
MTALRQRSEIFHNPWQQQPVARSYCVPRRLLHSQIGLLDLHCQDLTDPGPGPFLNRLYRHSGQRDPP